MDFGDRAFLVGVEDEGSVGALIAIDVGEGTVMVKRFCNMSVQSTYVEYLVSNGVRYPL